MARALLTARAGWWSARPPRTVVGTYRPTGANVAMVAGFALVSLCLTGDLTDAGVGGPMWSWRVPVAAVVWASMSVRAWRRGVTVTTAGIEGRRLGISWRVPWPSVAMCGVGDPHGGPEASAGLVTVTLVDRTIRRAPVGRGRRGDPSFDDAVRAVRSGGWTAPSDHQEPNWPLVAWLGAGIGLLGAMAMADTGRMNERLARREAVSYTADQLRELRAQIAGAQVLTAALAITAAVTGVLAVVNAARQRGVAPSRPGREAVDDATSGAEVLERSPRLIVSDHEIFDPDGRLVTFVSHGRVPWAFTAVDVYSSPRGASLFCVHHVGTRWHLTSWRAPLDAWVEHEHAATSTLVLHLGGVTVGRATQRTPSTYVATDDHGETIGSFSRSGPTWTCTFPEGTAPTTRRLLCVAAIWVARRHHPMRIG